MRKVEKQEFDSLLSSVVKLFHSRCYVCREPYTPEDAFTIHHLDYKSGEKTWVDFKNGDHAHDKLEYYRYLVPIIKQEPRRFMLLHHKHHWMAETWARLKPDNFDRMVKVARQINRMRFRK